MSVGARAAGGVFAGKVRERNRVVVVSLSTCYNMCYVLNYNVYKKIYCTGKRK